MSFVNFIQKAILQLDGGTFQKLFDEYLYKKYRFKNIQTLGVQTGTNKPTKGVPDSYVITDDEKYILINYGSVSSKPAEKIRDDILACFNRAKLSISKDKIKKIICGHCSTNIHIEQFSNIIEAIKGVKVELIGIDTLSHDLALIYPHIAKDMLGIAIDTNQFFDVDDFVKVYDANGINAPIDCEFLHRESEISDTCNSINNHMVTILTGPSGIGKTRLALEVCRKLDNGDVKIYCIKNNGNLLYEDIKYYISEPGKYIIFFDDANEVVRLNNTFNTILNLSKDYEIKILITVRDYARDRVINVVSRYSKPNIIQISGFKDDEIKDILKNNLQILNLDYLRKITEIANGNIRLAFLAGMKSINDGYQKISNVEDIFKNYYGTIINDAKLTKDDIMMLFFIAVAGPVRSDENQLFCNLKKMYGNNILEKDTIENLYSLELIDWFKNEITKISDQSLGNYIIYYVLFEKKWISVESLITIGFPYYRNKVIYVINTLINIFHSKELSKYVENSIISAWEKVPKGQEMQYLESFYSVNPDKSLSIIKKHIELENIAIFDLHSFDINSKKNYRNISTKEIEILGGYKYTDNFGDSIDLLMRYFARRPDLIMDFYFVLSDHLLYDKYSWKYKYSQELLLLDKLWEATEEGVNFNNSILYLEISKCALKTEISYTEEDIKSRSCNFVRMSLGFTEEIVAIRRRIWKNLSILRKYEEYRDIVNKILLKVYFHNLNKEDSKKYLQLDFDVIYEDIIDKNNLNFFDAKIVARYKKEAEKIGVTIDNRYLISKSNQEFKIYKMLIGEHLIGRTIEEDEKIRKDFISKEISLYTLADYQRLFISCRFLEKNVHIKNHKSLKTGLDYIFEVLEDNVEFYVNVVTEYLNEKAPFKLDGYRQIKYLINHIGYEATLALVNRNTFDKKKVWLSLIWECLPVEDISEKVVNDYKKFVINTFAIGDPTIPTLQLMKCYGERDKELKIKMIEGILDYPELSIDFLCHAYRDDVVEDILYFFRDDLDVLITIYMSVIKNSIHVDYAGKLFIKIFEQRPMIWNAYVNLVKDNIRQEKIFELIWTVEEWRKCIDYAFKVLIDENKGFLITKPARVLFKKSQNESILERKKMWLLDKLHERSMDLEKCKNLFNLVVTVLPDWKLEYILEFVKENKKIEDFKKLQLFPSSFSWSGSEVPLILEKINFLKCLKDSLKGIDYINHRNYLDEQRRNLEKYQKEVELREYIEDEDYA